MKEKKNPFSWNLWVLASKMLWSTGVAYLVADRWIIWVEKWLVVSAMGHGTWDTIYVDDSMLRSWKSCSRNVCKTHIESLSWFLFYFGREGGLEFKILRNYYFCKEYPYICHSVSIQISDHLDLFRPHWYYNLEIDFLLLFF